MKSYSFHEYMDSKKQIKSPVVDPTGDQIDPKTMPNKPPKEGYAKGGQEYSTGKKKTTKGSLGGLGDIKKVGWENSIYKPKVDDPHGTKPAKLPTVEQIQLTKAMVQDMLKHPELVEQFVKQTKCHGMLGILVAEVFEQKESAAHLAEIMSHQNHGPKVLRNLTRALNEETAQPLSKQLPETEEDIPSEDPSEENDEEDDELNLDDENEPNLDVAFEDPNQNAMMDPAMMGQNAPMDPNMMNMNPAAMGGMMQPSPMMGQGNPSMMQPPMGQQPPQMPMLAGQPPQMMHNFQKAMMRAYQRAMMRKK